MVIAVLALIAVPQARADEKDDLRQKALSLNDVTGDDTIGGEVKALMAKPAEAKKLISAAAAMAKEKEQPFNFTAARILGEVAVRLKDPESGRAFFWICAEEAIKLQSSVKLNQAYSGLLLVIDEFYLDKKYDESSKLAQKLIELLEKGGYGGSDGMSQVIWPMIRAQVKQGKVAEATKMVDSLTKARPKSWKLLEVKAKLKIELNEMDEARRLYEEILGRVEKDSTLKKDEKEFRTKAYQYTLSGLFIELNQADKAIEVLRKLLAKDPQSATYNNDLGYVLADNNRDLDEAEKMIRLALELDRKARKEMSDLSPEEDHDSTPYLDSLGWVLFKKKKYAEAKKELLEATKDKVDGQHVEILDHLAEVHMALGEKAEALAVWKRALAQESLSNRDKIRKAAIEKKIKDASK
jgi:tetratricopeptide (TPR) repeat protein